MAKGGGGSPKRAGAQDIIQKVVAPSIEQMERVQRETIILCVCVVVAVFVSVWLTSHWGTVIKWARPVLEWWQDYRDPLPPQQSPAPLPSSLSLEEELLAGEGQPLARKQPSAGEKKGKGKRAGHAGGKGKGGAAKGEGNQKQQQQQQQRHGSKPAQAPRTALEGSTSLDWAEGEEEEEEEEGSEWTEVVGGSTRGRRVGTSSDEELYDSEPPELQGDESSALGALGLGSSSEGIPVCPCCGRGLSSPPPDSVVRRNPNRQVYHPSLGLLPLKELERLKSAYGVEGDDELKETLLIFGGQCVSGEEGMG
jgi:hypothetical protein